MNKRIILLQIRDPKDVMATHEAECIRRRLVGLQSVCITRNVVETPLTDVEFAGVDGVIIGGSGDFSVHHPLSAHFVDPMLRTLDMIAARKLPTFAICFGHQLIGKWLGAVVVTDATRAELGTVLVSKTGAGAQHAVLSTFESSFFVHSGHSDWVVDIPSDCTLLLENDRVRTQAFEVRGLPFMSVQFHPDMTGAEARARLLAYREGFSDRIETDAETFVSRFSLGEDVSASMIQSFFRVHGWAASTVS